MSNNGKRRPRKAKLETRMFVEIDDENTTSPQMSEIQITDIKSVPAESFVIQQKHQENIAKNAASKPQTAKPFNFSVNVEVEEFEDENRLEIDESALQIDDTEMEVDIKPRPSTDKKSNTGMLTISAESHNLVIKQEKANYLCLSLEPTPLNNQIPPLILNPNPQGIQNIVIKQELDTDLVVITETEPDSLMYNVPDDKTTQSRVEVTESQILDVAKTLIDTSSNMADKILAIEARNIVGSLIRIKLHHDLLEEKLQDALDDWRNWADDRERMPPLLYKCYICRYSCWYLSEYREHLNKHRGIIIKISVEETSIDECNIITYIGIFPKLIDIETKGNCWRCQNDFSVHRLKERTLYGMYKCDNCTKLFSTCYELREHQHTNKVCCKHIPKYKCWYCTVMFTSISDRETHMTITHHARSDVPVHSAYKKCNNCHMKYFMYDMHSCQNKVNNYQCNFCFRSFTHQILADLHMCNANSSCSCRVCGLQLPKRCMELEHMLMHTTRFIFPFKCVSCEEFVVYLDEESLAQHTYIKHKLHYDKKRNYDKVLIPIACILPNFESLNFGNIQEMHQVSEPRVPVLTEAAELTLMDPEINFKVEPEQLVIKEETLSDQEYEDDIIRLDLTETKLPKAKGRCRNKIYTCTKCGFKGLHCDYALHNFNCNRREILYPTEYPCTKCGQTFDKLKKYINHLVQHDLVHLSCPECHADFDNYTSLIPHMNTHVKQSFLKISTINNVAQYESKKMNRSCKKCMQEVRYEDMFVHWEGHLNIKNNLELIVDNVETEQCDNKNLSKEFPGLKKEYLDNLLQHLQADVKIKDCPHCGRHFNRNYECKRHIVEHLLSDAYARKPEYGTLKCQICGEGYLKVDRYKRHMRDHGSLPIFQCEICDKTFSDSSNFTKHKKYHNLQVLICDICNKKFQAKSSLIKHMEMHRVTKPETCELCNKVFFTKTLYKKHMRNRHDPTQPKFTCGMCKVRFNTCKEKWDHLWEVHKERQYQADCRVCGKKFRKQHDVKRHVVRDHNLSFTFYQKRNFKKTEAPSGSIQMFLPRPKGLATETLVIYEP